jgi:hypothetical protein
VRKHLATAFALQREDGVRSDTFRSWAVEARRRRSIRTVSAARAAETVFARARRDAAAALADWRGYVARRAEKRVASDAARLVRRLFLRASAFYGWALCARWQVSTREKGVQLTNKTRLNATRRVVEEWVAMTLVAVATRAAAREVECDALATKHAEAALIRKTVATWAAAARAALTAALVAKAKGSRLRRSSLAHAIRTWRLSAAEAVAWRAAVERAEDHHDLRVARTALTRWSDAVAHLSAEKEAEETAFEHYAGAVLGRMMASWVCAAASARRAKVAAVWWYGWHCPRTLFSLLVGSHQNSVQFMTASMVHVINIRNPKP